MAQQRRLTLIRDGHRSEDHLADRVGLLCALLGVIESASHALEWWVDEGEPVTIEVLESRERPLLPSEYMMLRTGHTDRSDPPVTKGIDRVGLLRSPRSKQVLAVTRALILPSRLPHVVRLEAGLAAGGGPTGDEVPLGASLLAHYVDIRRDLALAKPVRDVRCGHRVVALSRALLVVDGRPAAIATERYTETLVTAFTPPADLTHAAAELAAAAGPVHHAFPPDALWTGSDQAGVLRG